MATYYLDPAATGADNGTSWANAWTTLVRAIAGTGGTAPTAGDIVYCRGSETPGALIQVNNQTGTVAGGMIRYVGCNAAGVIDGTRYTLTFPGSSGINAGSGKHRHSFENFHVASSYVGALNYNGFVVGSSGVAYNWRFINCLVSGWTSTGFACLSSSQRQTFLNCVAAGCEIGFSSQNESHSYINCLAYQNASHGFSTAGARAQLWNCVAHSNFNGLRVAYTGCYLLNCVFYGNTNAGIWADATVGRNQLLGCRVVRNGLGILAPRTDQHSIVLASYFAENAGGNAIGPVMFLDYRGNRYQNILNGTDVNHGFVSPGSPDHDYRLRDDASLRDVPFLIP